MARVTIRREWGADDAMTITVAAASSYPDALDQARATAQRAFADALGVVLASEAKDDE